MGTAGIVDRPFPLTGAILLSPDILTSAAFNSSAERDRVPAWRDGALGCALQRRMSKVATRRFFEFGGITSSRPLFASGGSWAAFARVAEHMDQMFLVDFGESDTWEDGVTLRFREFWRGDYDHECVAFCAVAGAHLDASPHQFISRLKTDMPCVSRLLRGFQEAQALRSATSVGSLGSASVAEESTAVKDEDNVKDGVMSSGMDGFHDMSAGEKKKLAADLSSQAAAERDAAIQKAISRQASNLLRTRLLVVRRMDQVKHYLESDQRGLTMRMAYIDITMPQEQQTSRNNRKI
jgi:hypothetical protein